LIRYSQRSSPEAAEEEAVEPRCIDTMYGLHPLLEATRKNFILVLSQIMRFPLHRMRESRRHFTLKILQPQGVEKDFNVVELLAIVVMII